MFPDKLQAMGLVAKITWFGILMTTAAFAGHPRTDDLLLDLDPGLRKKILDGIGDDDTGLCHLRVLEKDFKVKFKPGPPRSDSKNVPIDNQCARDAPAPVIRIASAADLTTEDFRTDWLWSYYGWCAYKKQFQTGLERAAAKLKKNPNYTFITQTCVRNGQGGTVASPLWKQEGRCLAAAGNSSTALECFYNDKCSFDCGGGALNLQMLGTYELYAGADGIMSPAERKLFDEAYPEIATGKYAWPRTDGLEYRMMDFNSVKDKNTGRRKRLETKGVDLNTESVLGENALVGLRLVVDTKTAYKSMQFEKDPDYKLKESAQLTSNSIVVSTSAAAIQDILAAPVEGARSSDKIIGRFEEDMKTITDLYVGKDDRAKARGEFLSYNENATDNPSTWETFDQLSRISNRKAIVDGTYLLKRHPKLTDAQWKYDQAAYAKIQSILQQPLYRDTKIYIHPRGIVTLSDAILAKKTNHPEAVLTVWTGETHDDAAGDTDEDLRFQKFLNYRVQTCLESAK